MKKTLNLLLIFILLTSCSNSNLYDKEDLILIAHRGAKDIAPEHTLPAYQKAIDLNADFIEIDLRMTSDGHLVSIHDQIVDRTTNGTGKVFDYTLSDLRRLDAGSWFGEEFKGEKVPTLDEIFDSFGKETNYYIETRLVDGKPLMEEKLVKILESRDLQNHVIIQSFSEVSLKKINQYNKNIPLIQLLYKDSLSTINLDQVQKYAIGVGPFANDLTEDWVGKFHQANLKVHVWFNHESEKEYMPKVLSYGVDAVFTDFISNTIEVMKQEIVKQ